MFTGLIAAVGSVLSLEERQGSRRIVIASPRMELRKGDSIAVSGVCLTAVDIEPAANPPRFHADLAAETITRTSLGQLAPGSAVNLELPSPAGAPLGGHIVQGHVDGTGTLLSLTPVDPKAEASLTDWWMRVALPPALGRYMVEKGSIAIEGISLTIARWNPSSSEGDVVEAAIIPHTYSHTNLSRLRPGQPVNIEADVMLKFFEQKQRDAGLSLEFLVANGY